MEELLKEEKDINRRIDEILDYDNYNTPEINALSKRIDELWSNNDEISIEEKKELLDKSRQLSELKFQKTLEFKSELDKLYDRLQEIGDLKLKLISPVIVGERIGLKNLSDSICYEYLITLNDTNEIIGNITYRGHHVSDFLGDVGFNVGEKYRGNGYAYEALQLLSSYLFEHGIKDFWISAYATNIPSAKTIRKYGGKNISKYDGILLYECETRQIINEKSGVLK